MRDLNFNSLGFFVFISKIVFSILCFVSSVLLFKSALDSGKNTKIIESEEEQLREKFLLKNNKNQKNIFLKIFTDKILKNPDVIISVITLVFSKLPVRKLIKLK